MAASGLTGPPADLPYPVQGDIPDAAGDIEMLALAIQPAILGMFPTGTILAFGGAGTPEGWAMCDGTVHGSAALQALLNSPNAPDMRDRFLIGATPKAVRSTGGNPQGQVALTAAHVPSHAHSLTSGGAQNNSHTHNFNASSSGTAPDTMTHNHTWAGGGNPIAEPARNHPDYAKRNRTGNSRYYHGAGVTAGTSGARGSTHAHTVTFAAVGSGGQTANHTHAMTSDSAGGGALHGGMPPYYAVNFIIKK